MQTIREYKKTNREKTENDKALGAFFKRVVDDFNDYLEEGHDLCGLSNLFDQRYDDPQVEQLYLLRYVYAYALENLLMYQWVLEDRKSASNLSVESIGCGSFVDAWALKYAAEHLNYSTEGVMHTGVDLVDWHYKFNSLDSKFIHGDAGAYFDQKKTLDSDVYIFPRSIGDFPDSVFQKILYAFQKKPLTKPVIYLMISQRRVSDPDDEKKLVVKQIDASRTGMFFDTLYQRDYDYFSLACEKDYQEERLRNYDKLFEYPIRIYKKLNNLHDECICYKKGDDCENNCQVDRSPILAMKNFSYNVFKFERKPK